jgi:hypothetical protein
MRVIMDGLEKLKKLLPHWMEHNDEHAKTYKDWAERMSSLGKEELSEVLKAIYHESHKLRKLFEEALRVVDASGV